MDIDLVYLWVNGNDPKWIAKRDAFIGKPTGKQENCAARYTDSGELKYSLRSIEKYAPWIRKIFIVTDNQVPEWLDTSNPRVQIVDHSEILPQESLPCFNSTLLEHFLHRIPGLSEHFIYGNDDTYLNQPVTPTTFYSENDGLPNIYMFRKPLRRIVLRLMFFLRKKVLRKPMNLYVQIVWNTAELVKKRYGKYYACKPHHNFDAYLKSNIIHTHQEFNNEITAMYGNHKRRPDEIHRSLYNFSALAEKRGHLRYVTSRHSFCLSIDNRKLYRKFEQDNPIFFCMNDSTHATQDDRYYSIHYLELMFPEKSRFEK